MHLGDICGFCSAVPLGCTKKGLCSAGGDVPRSLVAKTSMCSETQSLERSPLKQEVTGTGT